MKNLQIFGCDEYAKILTHRKKFEEKSKKYTFVGYASMGLWDSEMRKIIISREVIFVQNPHDGTQEKSEVERNTLQYFAEDSENSDSADEGERNLVTQQNSHLVLRSVLARMTR